MATHVHQIKRIAHNATNRAIRGRVISIVGFTPAVWFDSPRVIVRLVNDDGSLGTEYRVLPGIIIDL